MFHILGFLFIIIIAILIIGLSIIGTVLRNIFGLGKRRTTTSRPYQNNGSGYQQPDSSQEETTETYEDIHSKRKKLFAKDEGEYVDFEEIKEK